MIQRKIEPYEIYCDGSCKGNGHTLFTLTVLWFVKIAAAFLKPQINVWNLLLRLKLLKEFQN